MLAVSGCSNKTNESNVLSSDTDITDSENKDNENFDIKTDYITLYFPNKWKESVNIKINDDIVSFSALPDDIKLFDIMFGKNEGDIIGTLSINENNIPVSVKTYDIDNNLEKYDEYREMQEDINTVINMLENDKNFSYGAFEDKSLYEIETNVAKLYFPKNRENEVDIAVSDNKVSFSCENTSLFDIYFGGSEGDLLGTYNDTEIRLVMYDINDDKLNAIQEDVNVIIENLEKDSNFASNIN